MGRLWFTKVPLPIWTVSAARQPPIMNNANSQRISILPAPDGLFVGGEDGLIFHIEGRQMARGLANPLAIVHWSAPWAKMSYCALVAGCPCLSSPKCLPLQDCRKLNANSWEQELCSSSGGAKSMNSGRRYWGTLARNSLYK